MFVYDTCASSGGRGDGGLSQCFIYPNPLIVVVVVVVLNL